MRSTCPLLAELKTSTNDRLACINETLSAIEKHSFNVKDSSLSIKEDLQSLTSVLETKPEPVSAVAGATYDKIDSMFNQISSELKFIGEHVCPNSTTAAPPSSPTEPIGEVSLAMTPNTVSPHFNTRPSTPYSHSCEPYLDYKEEVVPAELKEELNEFVQSTSSDFVSVGGTRDVQYFGEFGYFYTGAYHPPRVIPDVIGKLVFALRPFLPEEDRQTPLNSCLITRYEHNSTIPMHSDDESCINPESVIVTISIGQDRTIQFKGKDDQTKTLNLKDGSMYTMSRFSQDFWKHGIEEGELTDCPNQRYSFTFRHIAQYFNNSTALIGDSNTKYVKFGQGFGTLGKWTPGKRIEAFKVEDIPPPHEIGPFRNIVIHTGINNIKSEINRRSNRSIIDCLRRKCDSIHSCYPNSKIYLSLLLPTKSHLFNAKVSALNNLILDLTFNRKNTFIIDHSILGSDSGTLPPELGRFSDGRPNPNDIIHLGRKGITLFCKSIKRCIMQKGSSQARERFRGSNGSYRNAASRGRRRVDPP